MTNVKDVGVSGYFIGALKMMGLYGPGEIIITENWEMERQQIGRSR